MKKMSNRGLATVICLVGMVVCLVGAGVISTIQHLQCENHQLTMEVDELRIENAELKADKTLLIDKLSAAK